MTDMAAEPVSLKDVLQRDLNDLEFSPQEMENLQRLDADIKVHGGMAEAALYVYKRIKKQHLLEMAHVQYSDYPLVVTGHSLGAGTAVILAFILRLRYSNVKCLAYGPPGGLLSEDVRFGWTICRMKKKKFFHFFLWLTYIPWMM